MIIAIVLILIILALLLFLQRTKETFDISHSEPSAILDNRNGCDEQDCVPLCWDETSSRCLTCKNHRGDICDTKSQAMCERCPYCVWDTIEEECIPRPMGVIPDEYDTDPYRGAFEINRPHHLDDDCYDENI